MFYEHFFASHMNKCPLSNDKDHFAVILCLNNPTRSFGFLLLDNFLFTHNFTCFYYTHITRVFTSFFLCLRACVYYTYFRFELTRFALEKFAAPTTLATMEPAAAPRQHEIGQTCQSLSQSRGMGKAPTQAPAKLSRVL